MTVSVIIPPDPIVEPSDIAGSHSGNDATVAAMIAAVTEEIDGPTGWLGRCLGPQTLELTMPAFCGWNFLLPFPPVIKVVSISYLDRDGVEQTIDEADYRFADKRVWFGLGYSFPSTQCAPDAVRVVYQAGYNGSGAGKTGEIPERARQAIILSVQHLKSLSVESLYLRSVEIPDVETRQFTLSDQASNIVERTCDRLLSTLRVY